MEDQCHIEQQHHIELQCSWKYPYALRFRGSAVEDAVEDSQPIVYDENNEESLHV